MAHERVGALLYPPAMVPIAGLLFCPRRLLSSRFFRSRRDQLYADFPTMALSQSHMWCPALFKAYSCSLRPSSGTPIGAMIRSEIGDRATYERKLDVGHAAATQETRELTKAGEVNRGMRFCADQVMFMSSTINGVHYVPWAIRRAYTCGIERIMLGDSAGKTLASARKNSHVFLTIAGASPNPSRSKGCIGEQGAGYGCF